MVGVSGLTTSWLVPVVIVRHSGDESRSVETNEIGDERR